jgi:DNA-binding PadR family transcriptional regulator
MELSAAERLILDRYHEKSRIAGGPRKGYVLRQRAIRYREAEHPGLDLGAGLDELVEKGLLAASEDRRFYFLTEAGAQLLVDWR